MNKRTMFCCTRSGARFSAKPIDLIKYQRCPICEDSSPKNSIERFLDIAGISYRKNEMYIAGCVMKFDFFLPGMNLAINYSGKFYYDAIPMIRNDTNDIAKRKIEREYCKEHKIKLLRIPFWERERIDEILYGMFLSIDEETSYTSFMKWKGKLHFGGYRNHK